MVARRWEVQTRVGAWKVVWCLGGTRWEWADLMDRL